MTNKLAQRVALIHHPLDKTLLRVLSLFLGFAHVFLLMWDPTKYAEDIGGFNALISPLMIWAICSSMIYGIGFKPIRWYWQLLFSPYFSFIILLYLSIRYIQ